MSYVIKKNDYVKLLKVLNNTNIKLALSLLILTTLIGIIGWTLQDKRIDLLLTLFSDFSIKNLAFRHENLAPITVLTRITPYFLIAYFACYERKIDIFFISFSVFVSLAFFLVPINHVSYYLNYVCTSQNYEGFQYTGWNRGVLGYEAAIASFILLITGIKSYGYKKITMFLLGCLAVCLVTFSWTKGPILIFCLTLVILTIFGLEKKYLFSYFLIMVFFIFLYSFYMKICMGLDLGMFSFEGVTKKLLFDLGISRTGVPSYEIRLGITKLFIQEMETNLLFGGGYGASRWSNNNLQTGMGSHIFLYDLYLDTGLFGLISFVFAILFLKPFYFISYFFKKTSSLDLMLIAFGLVLGFKLMIASDTYSEPLLVSYIVVLICTYDVRINKSKVIV